MSNATSLYRLHLTIALGGGLGVVLALLVALDAVRTHGQSPSALVGTVLVSDSAVAGASAALLLGLGVIVTTSLGLGLRAIWHECGSQWRAAGVLRASPIVELGGVAVRVIADDRPCAFCHGLLRPRIYVSTGTLAGLRRAELEAVLAHERHHAQRRDPLRLALARVLGEALFFLPALPPLLERYAVAAELAADEAALRDGQAVSSLAGALLTFDEHGAAVDPDRVDGLVGEHPPVGVPTASILSTAAIIIAVVGLGLAGATLNGHGYLPVAIPALLVAVGLAGVALVTPMRLLGGIVESRCGRRTR